MKGAGCLVCWHIRTSEPRLLCKPCRNTAGVGELLLLLLNQSYACGSLPGPACPCLSVGQRAAEAAAAGPWCPVRPGQRGALIQPWARGAGADGALGEGCHLGRRAFELEGNRVRAPFPTSRLGQQRIRLFSCWCLNLVLRLFVAKAFTNSVKPTSISSLIKLPFSVK